MLHSRWFSFYDYDQSKISKYVNSLIPFVITHDDSNGPLAVNHHCRPLDDVEIDDYGVKWLLG